MNIIKNGNLSLVGLFYQRLQFFAPRAMFWSSETPSTLASLFINKCFQTTIDKSAGNSQRSLEIRLRLKMQSKCSTLWQINIEALFGSQLTVNACTLNTPLINISWYLHFPVFLSVTKNRLRNIKYITVCQ